MRHSSLYNNQHTGSFCIDPMPAQPQVALCHSFFVPLEKRGNGLAHELKALQAQQLEWDGYDFGICTVRAENQAQLKVLEQAGWRKLAEFKDSRLGGMTQLWGYHVVP